MNNIEVRILVVAVLVMVFEVSICGANGCATASQSAENDELLHRFDFGDRTYSTLWQLAWNAKDPEKRRIVLERLERELRDTPDAFQVAQMYYRALMHAERFNDAARAARGVWRAVCGENGYLDCSGDDIAFVESYVIRLEVDAKAAELLQDETLPEVIDSLDPLLQKAVAVADQISSDYVRPDDFGEFLFGGFFHPALNARSFRAEYLHEAKRTEAARDVWNEMLRLCPNYEPEQECSRLQIAIRRLSPTVETP